MIHLFSSRSSRASLSFEALEQRNMLSATAIGDELLVNDFVPREQSIAGASMAVASSSTNSVVVFEGKGPRDRQGVFAEVLDADGQTIAPSFRVNSTLRSDQYAPAVDMDSEGNFVVAWAGRGVGDKQGVFFQRYDASGSAIESETLVNETVGGKQTEPAIAIASDGSFVVAWSGVGTGDVSGVFLRRFDAEGNAIAGEVLVNTTTEDHQTSPSVEFDSSGNLVVAWQSRHQDGSDWGVYGQWFAPDGTRIGEETSLNETTTASQSDPVVSDDPTAGVVVGWQSRDQDGDSWGVVAREFDASGNAVSTERQLNDQTEGHQQDLAIDVAQDGQWLTAWSNGVPDGTGWEVVAKSIEVDGSAGSTQTVNNETGGANSGHQQAPAVAIAGDQALIAWSGVGAQDHRGVYTQQYEVDVNDGDQLAPELDAIEDRDGEVGTEIEILVSASDANLLDSLTFLLDGDNSPTDAVLEQIDNNSARILWTPPASALGEKVPFRVLVIDDGEPPLADSEDFSVIVGEITPESVLFDTSIDEAFASFE